MDSKVNYKVSSKETFYFYVRLITSLGLYALLGLLISKSFESENPAMKSAYVMYAYAVVIFVYLFFAFGILIGYIKGNAVKLSKNQFPDIYEIIVKQSELLGLKTVPSAYIMQSGGVLNAFAARFIGRNYIVLYSEIVETAYEQDINILGFIIGHELGHIKRHHMQKNLLLFPSYLIPFLGAAYSRACEYTCDNIGSSLAPKGLRSGLLLLASGRSLYKKVNLNEYLAQASNETGFWIWFAEKVSSHPNLTKRLAALNSEMEAVIMASAPIAVKRVEDASHYMPR